MSTASTIIALILSGDVDAAWDAYLDAGRPAWSPKEARGIRHACSKWGRSADDFGAPAPGPVSPEWWAIRAHLMLAPIPQIATSDDFQAAAMDAASNHADGAYLWRMEAIRWRRLHPTAALDNEVITAAAVETGEMFARRFAA